MDYFNFYQIFLITFVFSTNVILIRYIYFSTEFSGDFEIKDFCNIFINWCIYMILSFCAYYYLGNN